MRRKNGILPKKVNLRQSHNIMAQNHRIRIKQDERPNSSNNIVEEDDEDFDSDSDTESTGSSTSSESDVEVNSCPKHTNTCLDNTESDGESDSSSTDCSSSSSNSSHSKTITQAPSQSLMCAKCGQGPFRSMTFHLLHCQEVRQIVRCFLCKEVFLTAESLKEHHMLLFSCDVCGQVFSHEPLFKVHPCPKRNVSPLVLFCSEAMPKVCSICKYFFSSERMLLAHVIRTHVSLVKTKVRIFKRPSLLSNPNILTVVPRTDVQSTTAGSHRASQPINGELNVHHTCSQSTSPVVKSSFSPIIKSESEPVTIGERDITFPPNRSAKGLSPALFEHHTDATLTTAVPEPDSTSTSSILASVKNESPNVDLIERINTNWRSKATYSCRECGAIFRQPSLMISHRYLHRGRRSHYCRCGRAFKHQLHLLRHCVEHAETVNYICVSCGDTFPGAKLLAQHLKGNSPKKSHSGCATTSKVKKKCRMPFRCDCGQRFSRPSAYIWHQLKNRTKS